MKGRHPKPEVLRQAQGNPGHRAAPSTLPDDTAPKGLPFAALGENARRAYEIISGDLRRMNFVRGSDESLLMRYCSTVARYWKVSAELDALGGETYEAATQAGGIMQRMRPQFIVMDRLARLLDGMEDRLGLSPMARQQYMIRMASASAPQLPMEMPEKPAPRAGSAVGMLRHGATLN